MTQKKKNNIIIGSLCAVVLLMGIAYAAFNTILNINGTTTISSNWNIHFDSTKTQNIEGVVVGTAGLSGANPPTGTVTYSDNKLTANLATTLKQPGDKVVYTLTVLNEGSIDAKLDKLTVTKPTNTAISFSTSGLKEGDPLKIGSSRIIVVTIGYNENVTSQPDSVTETIGVTLDFVQDDNSGNIDVPTSDKFVYRYGMDTVEIGTSLDSINGATEDYNTLGHNVFVKHKIVDSKVASTEACFIKNGVHCLKPGEYETTKSTLVSIFGADACEVDDTKTRCKEEVISILAIPEGDVYVYSGTEDCDIYNDGSSECFG